jgi:GAF domain-containing protein
MAAQSEEIVQLIHKAGSCLRLEDVFSVIAIRLRYLVPHESLAVYCPHGESLMPEFVSGENSRLFSSLRIPLGEGLSGWVAQNHKSILNGNPSVEPGYLNDATKYSTLRSALAVPIEAEGRVLAVLALYRAGQDAFSRDDQRLLEDMAAKVAGGLAKVISLKASAAAGGAK